MHSVRLSGQRTIRMIPDDAQPLVHRRFGRFGRDWQLRVLSGPNRKLIGSLGVRLPGVTSRANDAIPVVSSHRPTTRPR